MHDFRQKRSYIITSLTNSRWYLPVFGFNSTNVTVSFLAFSNGHRRNVLHIVTADWPSSSLSIICHVDCSPDSIHTPRSLACWDVMDVSFGSSILPLTIAVSYTSQKQRDGHEKIPYLFCQDNWYNQQLFISTHKQLQDVLTSFLNLTLLKHPR